MPSRRETREETFQGAGSSAQEKRQCATGGYIHPNAYCLAGARPETRRLDQPPQAALACLRVSASPASAAATSSADVGSGTLVLQAPGVPLGLTQSRAPVALTP